MEKEEEKKTTKRKLMTGDAGNHKPEAGKAAKAAA